MSSTSKIKNETKQEINTILAAVYGRAFDNFAPSHKTVPVMADFISKLATCNKKISDLLTSLSLLNGQGVAIKLISTAAKIAK
ncbi:hypothetical protein [Thalassotalea ganghwensis]